MPQPATPENEGSGFVDSGYDLLVCRDARAIVSGDGGYAFGLNPPCELKAACIRGFVELNCES
jgi:hypothetical protein